MLIEPDFDPAIEAEHEDGCHDGETMKYSSYCLDCFNILDRMIDDMLDNYIP